jgi:hypothetical protein
MKVRKVISNFLIHSKPPLANIDLENINEIADSVVVIIRGDVPLYEKILRAQVKIIINTFKEANIK